MDRHRQKATDIEVLKEILESLKITEEYVSDGNKTIELVSKEILTAPILAVHNETAQTVIPKSIVPDPG